jgi:hypothetical protein
VPRRFLPHSLPHTNRCVRCLCAVWRRPPGGWAGASAATARNGSNAATVTLCRHGAGWAAIHWDRTVPDRVDPSWTRPRSWPRTGAATTSSSPGDGGRDRVAAAGRRAGTPASRSGSSTSGVPSSTTAAITVAQATPNSAARGVAGPVRGDVLCLANVGAVSCAGAIPSHGAGVVKGAIVEDDLAAADHRGWPPAKG